MKVKDIIRRNSFSESEFVDYLVKEKGIERVPEMGQIELEDALAFDILKDYYAYQNEISAKRVAEKKAQQQPQQEPQPEEYSEISQVTLGQMGHIEKNTTTTDSFENHQIESYLGTVFGTDIYLVGGLAGGGLVNQEKLFGYAFDKAKSKMCKKACDLGADGIVGMQTTVTSPGGMNNMIVVVTGTAVKLKEEENTNQEEYDNAEMSGTSYQGKMF